MSKDEDKEKMISERTVTYRGFKDAEEAKKFLDDMRGEMERTWRSYERRARYGVPEDCVLRYNVLAKRGKCHNQKKGV